MLCKDTAPRRSGGYEKVEDGRKQPVRGLWQRGGRYVARLTTETPDGAKKLVWHVLEGAKTVPEAKLAMAELDRARQAGSLLARGEAPTFAEFADRYLSERASLKAKATANKETTHLAWWRERIGGLRLDKIRKAHVVTGLEQLDKAGKAAQTRNLYLISLRNLLAYAKELEHIGTSPADDITWRRSPVRQRELVCREDFERVIAAAGEPRFRQSRLAVGSEPAGPLKNAAQFADYVRFLIFSGAREKEALRVRWADVDFNQRLVVIGAAGDSKNRTPRHVDFNPPLESHLAAMRERRAPDSQWLFPSPQRGERDIHAQTFRETLNLARAAVGLPGLGFHDTRHAFISQCVMAGIDFMTIAKWVGHLDGGVLIGKVYGHLANEHRQRMAARLSFGEADGKVIELSQEGRA